MKNFKIISMGVLSSLLVLSCPALAQDATDPAVEALSGAKPDCKLDKLAVTK
jgi:hypothetical protein